MSSKLQPQYQWRSVSVRETKFLAPLSAVLGENMSLFCASSEKISRLNADGMWMVKGDINGSPVAICWSDFRVKGASFGDNNTLRLVAFLRTISDEKLPLIFCVNSLGFRFVEGRKMFDRVFSAVPALIKFKRDNLLITLCQGKCLGIGAILFSLGHYRIAASPESSVNLTGPEVFQQFFGQKVDFTGIAGAPSVFKRTGLIHEIGSGIKGAFLYAAQLVTLLAYKKPLPVLTLPSSSQSKTDTASIACLQQISQQGIELFKGYDERLKAFVINLRGQQLAVLMNPPDQTNNMFSYRSLDLYQQALALFASLKLPLVVMIDTPGIDPRFDGDNKDIIEKVISVTDDLLNYPKPIVGVINGRGFGGANTLAMPKCYGAVARYGIKGRVQMDVMHESIMRELLSGSKNALESWQTLQDEQDPHCSDMVDGETLDEIVTYQELESRLWCDLFVNHPHADMVKVASSFIQADPSPRKATADSVKY